MSVTFHTKIDKRSVKPMKQVYLRPYAGKAYSFVPTGIYITEEIYQEHLEGTLKLHTNAAREYAFAIAAAIEKAGQAVTHPFSYEAWKALFRRENTDIDLATAFQLKIDTLKKINTREVYFCARNKLIDYPGFINLERLNSEDLFLIEEWMEETLSWSTIGIYMRCFRAVYNHLRKSGVLSNYPFTNYRPPVSQNTKKALYPHEIKKILEYQDEDYYNQRAADFWKICYLMFGKYPSDLQALKWDQIHDTHIEFTHRVKTARTRTRKKYMVPLTPQLKELIDTWSNADDHVFNFGNFHTWKSRVNGRLKNIGKEMEIGVKLTLQTARHSAATKLLHSGASVDQIQDVLMHHSRRTSENYLDSFANDYLQDFAKKLTD